MQHLENNYEKMAGKAKALFLTYDQEEIIRRNGLEADESWLYARLLDLDLRLGRRDAALEQREGESWISCPGVNEPMVLLDILCDSKPGRHARGSWRNTLDFGMRVHRNLAESGHASALEKRIDTRPELLRTRALAMGGTELGEYGGADYAFILPFFQDLNLLAQFWHGDEEFPPKLTLLWDAGAGDYLRYETMYYALALARKRLGDEG